MIWKILPVLILSGCGLFGQKPYIPETKPVEVVTVIQPAAVYHPVLPNSIATLPVEWTVLTPETMQEYLNDLNEGNAPTNAFYGLSTKGYENLSTTMSEIKRYIRQLQNIVQYYKSLDKETSEDESNK